MPTIDNGRPYANVYAVLADEPTVKVSWSMDHEGIPWLNLNIGGTITVHMSQESALEMLDSLTKATETMDQRVKDGYYLMRAVEEVVRRVR